MKPWLIWMLLPGCVDGLTQVAGTGAIYTVRCSAEMEVKGDLYLARCTPDPCTESFTSGPVSHVVVAIDPGTKLVGYAERVCIQDLAHASGLFNPVLYDDKSESAE